MDNRNMPTAYSPRFFALSLCVGALVLLLGALPGCDTPSTEQATEKSVPSPRIVCLSPALSRMLIDMGEGDHLVGVAQYDDPALGLPVCGNYADPDIERILALEAELVITEAQSPGQPQVPARLRELEEAGVLRVVALPQMRSIQDAKDALTHLEHGLGVVLDAPDQAAALRVQMTQQMDAITAAVAGAAPTRRPRVLMLMGTSPMGAIGPGVTHDELLSRAGGINVLADAGVGYVNVDRQMLIQDLRPDVILLISPSAPPLTEGDTRLRPLDGLPIRAVFDDRIVLINHPQALLPSSSLPEVLAAFARAIYPERAAAIDAAMTQHTGDERE